MFHDPQMTRDDRLVKSGAKPTIASLHARLSETEARLEALSRYVLWREDRRSAKATAMAPPLEAALARLREAIENEDAIRPERLAQV